MKTDSYVNYIDNLNSSYREVYDQVVLYVGLLDGMSERLKDEKLNDLLDVMLSAQEAGKPVEKVCGRDVRKFCREFCAEYDIRFGIYEVLRSCRALMWCILGTSLMFAIGWFLDPEINQSGSLLTLNVDMSSYTFLFIAAILDILYSVIGILERHFVFVTKRFAVKIFNGARLLLAIAGMAVIVLAFTKTINEICIPVGIQLIISIVWLGISYWLQSILKEDVEESFLQKLGIFGKTVSEQIPVEIDEQFPTAMEKKYLTMRDKKQSKGIAYSTEDFLADEEKTSDRMLKLKNFYLFLPIIFSVLMLLVQSVTMTGSDMSVVEVLLMVGITFIIESVVMMFVWKCVKGAALMRLAWIREKRESLEE